MVGVVHGPKEAKSSHENGICCETPDSSTHAMGGVEIDVRY